MIIWGFFEINRRLVTKFDDEEQPQMTQNIPHKLQ